MPTVNFFHKSTPVIGNGLANICIKAYEVSPGSLVILDDEEGGDSHEVAAGDGATPAEQAFGGTVALIVDIAGRRGLSIVAGDVSEVEEP
jgi:hypothetical protein